MQQQRTRSPPWARVNQACRGGTLCARTIDDRPLRVGQVERQSETSNGRKLDKEGLAHGRKEAVHPKNQEWASRSEPSKTNMGGPPWMWDPYDCLGWAPHLQGFPVDPSPHTTPIVLAGTQMKPSTQLLSYCEPTCSHSAPSESRQPCRPC